MSTKNNIFIRRNLIIRFCGEISSKKPLPCTKQIHRHSYWQMNFVMKGRVELYNETETMQFSAGDILILPPRSSHVINFSKLENLQMLSFKFDLTEDYHSSSDKFLLVRQDKFTRHWINVLEELSRSFCPLILANSNQQFSPGDDSSMLMPIEDLLWSILRFYYFIKPQSRLDGELFFRLRELVNAEGGRPLTVSAAARKLGYSVGHLRTLVKARTGESTKNFIDRQRVNIICNYLKYSDLNISELAEQTGFSNPLHFYRFFRKYTDTSPSAFRRECWH